MPPDDLADLGQDTDAEDHVRNKELLVRLRTHIRASGASLRYVNYRAAVRFETMFLG